jgi:hypothetical protein
MKLFSVIGFWVRDLPLRKRGAMGYGVNSPLEIGSVWGMGLTPP